MRNCVCDVCGMILDNSSPKSLKHKSDVFGYDLCTKHKMKEQKMDMRKIYLEKLKEDVE